MKPKPINLIGTKKNKSGELTLGVKWVNKPDAVNIYIGRGSALGNPWPITEEDTRDKVCNRYHGYLIAAITARDMGISNEINKIVYLLKEGTNVNLQCYCSEKD